MPRSSTTFSPIHGHTSSDGYRSPTYYSWDCMIGRCYRKTTTNYIRYGRIGIKVCKRWRKFSNFLTDMGERPAGKTLDRIDSSKNYYKENCRWSTPKEQANNRKKMKPRVKRS